MTQRYRIDTHVVSHIMQGRDAALLTRLTQLPVRQVVISSVTLAELEYGIHRKGQPARLKSAMAQVLLRMDVLAWDEAVAQYCGAFCCKDRSYLRIFHKGQWPWLPRRSRRFGC